MTVRAFPLSIYFPTSSERGLHKRISEGPYGASWIFQRFASFAFVYASVKLVYIHLHLRDPSGVSSVLVLHVHAATYSFAISLLKVYSLRGQTST